MQLLALVVFAVTQVTAAKKMKMAPNQEEDQTSFDIGVRVSNEYLFEEVAAYFEEIEKVATELKDTIGLKGFLVFHGKSGGNFQGWLDEDNPQRLTAKEAVQRVAEAIPEKAGVQLLYGRENFAETDKGGEDTFFVRLFGDDPDLLKDYADSIEADLKRTPGVLGVRMRDQQQPNEVSLVMDREQMAASGVNPEVVAGTIGYALQGRLLTRFNYEGREIPVRVRFEKGDRKDLADILTLPAPTDVGGVTPIGSVVDIEREDSPDGIFRQNRRVSRSIALELEPENVEQTRALLGFLVSQLDLPEGISREPNPAAIPIDDIRNMLLAAGLSVAFVYLLMAFLFESFILPLSIILTVPLAGLGVIWGHVIFDKDMDILGLIGCILLIGVVVNNGIVLIDYVNRLRAEGLERTQALLTATERRFRPITMTAMTTIIGMIPLTVSPANQMGISYKSFGVTLIGGMSTATALTLLVTPIFYTLFDDARQALSQTLAKGWLGRRGVEPSESGSVRSVG